MKAEQAKIYSGWSGLKLRPEGDFYIHFVYKNYKTSNQRSFQYKRESTDVPKEVVQRQWWSGFDRPS